MFTKSLHVCTDIVNSIAAIAEVLDTVSFFEDLWSFTAEHFLLFNFN